MAGQHALAIEGIEHYDASPWVKGEYRQPTREPRHAKEFELKFGQPVRIEARGKMYDMQTGWYLKPAGNGLYEVQSAEGQVWYVTQEEIKVLR